MLNITDKKKLLLHHFYSDIPQFDCPKLIKSNYKTVRYYHLWILELYGHCFLKFIMIHIVNLSYGSVLLIQYMKCINHNRRNLYSVISSWTFNNIFTESDTNNIEALLLNLKVGTIGSCVYTIKRATTNQEQECF